MRHIHFFKPFVILLAALFSLCGCSDQDAPGSAAPIVVIGNATVTGRSSATVNGTVSMQEGTMVTECGFIYSTVSVFPEESSTVIPLNPPSGTQMFEAQLTGLEPNTQYFYCLYASNGFNTVRSMTGTFTTYTDDVPHFATLTSINVTQTSITLRGQLTDEGGRELQSLGLCYKELREGDTSLPDISGEGDTYMTPIPPEEADDFTATIEHLSPNTTYRICAYGITASGTGYSAALDVTTLAAKEPTVDFDGIENNGNTVFLKAMIINPGSSEVTEVGFCWSTDTYPTVENSPSVQSTLNPDGTFEAELELEYGQNYTFRAYAINAEGIGYSLSAPSINIPESPDLNVETMPAQNVTTTSATLSGSLRGGIDVTERGFYLSDNVTNLFTDNAKIVVDTDAESFTYQATNLTPSTTYYYSTYAVSNGETIHGEVETFTTLAEETAVSFNYPTADDITSSSATLSVTITNETMPNITEAGFCYKIWDGYGSEQPTLEDNKAVCTVEGNGFSATLTELRTNTNYVYRAYAIVNGEVSYSVTSSFTTPISEIPGEGDIDNPGIEVDEEEEEEPAGGTETPENNDIESPDIEIEE